LRNKEDEESGEDSDDDEEEDDNPAAAVPVPLSAARSGGSWLFCSFTTWGSWYMYPSSANGSPVGRRRVVAAVAVVVVVFDKLKFWSTPNSPSAFLLHAVLCQSFPGIG
jgi:hypothetical protein